MKNPRAHDVKRQSQAGYAEAIKVLRAGGIIAYPTEAVWGLGCDPYNAHAFNRLLELKQRPEDKGVILVASCEQQLGILRDGLSEQQLQTLREVPAQPTTWLIPSSDGIPQWITGQHSSVAVRISRHPVVKSLCDAFGGMIVSTSANLAGKAPATTEQEARAIFAGGVDIYVSGSVGGQKKPSRIIDLVSGKVLR